MTPMNPDRLRYAFVVLTTIDGAITRFELTFAGGEMDDNGKLKFPIPAPEKPFESVGELLHYLATNCEALDAEEQ